MQVVQHEHDGTLGRKCPEEFAHAVEKVEASGLGLQDRGRRKIGEQLAELGEGLRHVHRMPSQLTPDELRIGLAKIASQGLHPGPVGRCPAGLPGTSDLFR